jgi:hypothetical protein
MPRTLAALALARSEKMHDIPSREAMLRIEADYEQLAKRIEERAKSSPRSNWPDESPGRLNPSLLRRA